MGGTSCEFPDSNPADDVIRGILEKSKRIAIVGLSDNPDRDSNRVAQYLISKGYNVIPVNPAKEEILGMKSYPDLKSIPEKIDIVDVFRNIEVVPGIVEEAIELNPGTIWLQLGLAHKESAEKAREAGINFVQSKCIKVEHQKLYGSSGPGDNMKIKLF